MTPDEFNTWVHDYGEHFPSIVNWLNQLEQSSEGLKAKQLGFWQVVLEDVTLEEATAATASMFKGDAEPVGTTNSDRERTASAVRRLCLDSRPREDTGSHDLDRYALAQARRRASPSASADRFAEVQRLIERGMSSKAATAQVFGIDGDDDFDRRQWFKCYKCEDTGRVSVWSRSAMLALRHDPEAMEIPSNRHAWVCACDCPKGDVLVERAKAHPKLRNWVQYDDDRDCLCPRGDTMDEENVAEFVEWCAALFEKLDLQRAQRGHQHSLPYTETGDDDGFGDAD